MKRLIRLSLVSLLSVTLMLLGPLSATAEPYKAMPSIPADPPYYFISSDLTASFEAAVGERGVSEVTSVAFLYDGIQDGIYVGAIDNSDNAMIWQYTDTGGDLVWTDLSSHIGLLKRINDISVFYSGVLPFHICLGGDDGTRATLNMFQIGDPNTDSFYDAGHSTITSLAYDWSTALGMTFAPSGFATFRTDDGIMERGDMANAANALCWPSASGEYFLAGTHSGTILKYAGWAGSVYAALPGVTDIRDLEWCFGAGFDLAAGMGSAGHSKLFKMVDGEDVTELNLPPTLTQNGLISWFNPYALIGGTGSQGHLYKWRQISGEFIDYDYMLSGMSRVNSMSSISDSFGFAGQDFSPLGPGPGGGLWIVGGAGSKKLVIIAALELSQNYDPAVEHTIDAGAGGATAIIPANAVSSAGNYDVLIEKLAPGSTPAALSGFSFLGASYDFECYDSLGNKVTEFNSPVTITIYYDEADLNGMSEDSLQIYWYNSETSAWEAVTPIYIDKVNNFCQIQVTHFSQFGILGMTQLPYTGA